MKIKLNHIIILIIWTTLSITSHGQTIKGKIILHGKIKSPLSGIQLISSGANPTVSNVDGEFTLKYPHKKPGDEVLIVPSKSGLAVINQRDLNIVLKNGITTLTIWMAEASELDRRRMQFFEINEEQITKAHTKKILKLKREKRLTQDTLQKLQSEFENVLRNNQKYSELFSTLEILYPKTKISEAIALLAEQKLDSAIELLDDREFELSYNKIDAKSKILDSTILSLLKNRDSLERSRKEIITALKLKATLYLTKLDFEGAISTYEKILSLEPNNKETLFEYTELLLNLNKYEKSIQAMHTASELDLTELDSFILNSNLSYAYLETNFDDSAEVYFKKAFSFKKINTDRIFNPLSLYLNYSTYLIDIGRINEADSIINLALNYIGSDPFDTIQQIFLAKNLTNLANIKSKTFKFSEAKKYYERSKLIYIKFRSNLQLAARGYFVNYLDYCASLISNNEILKADSILKIIDTPLFKSYKYNPYYFEDLIILKLNIEGLLYQKYGANQFAIEPFDSAYRMIQSSQLTKSIYGETESIILLNLGVCYKNLALFDSSLHFLKLAFNLRKDRIKSIGKSQVPYLANVALQLSILYLELGNIDSAQNYIQISSEYYNKVKKEFPGMYLDNIFLFENIYGIINEAYEYRKNNPVKSKN